MLAVNSASASGGPFQMNSYIAGCSETGDGIYIDPGAEVGHVIETAERLGVRLTKIVGTHAHLDHAEKFEVLRARSDTDAKRSEREGAARVEGLRCSRGRCPCGQLSGRVRGAPG